jgi:hypothetical protein
MHSPSSPNSLPVVISELRSNGWRLLTHPPSKSIITLSGGIDRTALAGLAWSRKRRPPTRRVRLRTVTASVAAVSGSTSFRNSATFPYGNNAASLAFRHRSSGVVEDFRVNTGVTGFSLQSRQPVTRRTWTGTLPCIRPKPGSVVALVAESPPALRTTAASLSVAFNLKRHHVGLDRGQNGLALLHAQAQRDQISLVLPFPLGHVVLDRLAKSQFYGQLQLPLQVQGGIVRYRLPD